MSTVEMLVPFTLDATGQVAATADPDVQAAQHVASLVTTNPGERVMLPSYGVPLASYLFNPGPDIVTQQVVLDVRAQMQEWEPSLTVTNIVPVTTPTQAGLGVAAVDVSFESTPLVTAATQTATVSVGGTVTPG